MQSLKLRFSVRTFLFTVIFLGALLAILISSKNKRAIQSDTSDLLHENFVFLSEMGASYKRQFFLVDDPDGQLIGNDLPVRDPTVSRNHWAEIGSRGYEHVYVTDKSKLSVDKLSAAFEKLPWLKSAAVHKELFDDTEVRHLKEKHPAIEFHLRTLITR